MGQTYEIFYAIREKKIGRLIAGHDFNVRPPKPIWADEWTPARLFGAYELPSEIKRRCLSKARYDIVDVRLEVIGARKLDDLRL
ncbi:MAG: hypothetical protein J6S60_01455 [Oscillospiraceae bacterium]|nr:hypothetical protein [Oscillospiraceae bacterium]